MTTGEYLEFALFFGFLMLWIIVHSITLLNTARVLKTKLGSLSWRNSSVKQVKLISGIFLLAGLLFLGFSLSALDKGTFKWKGKPKTYSFSDFLK